MSRDGPHAGKDLEAGLQNATGRECGYKNEKLNIDVEATNKRASAMTTSTLQGTPPDEKRFSFPKFKLPRHGTRKSTEKESKAVPTEEQQQQQHDPLAHLPDHEREILRKQLDTPPVDVSVKTLFRYATRNDLIIMVVSAICAIAG